MKATVIVTNEIEDLDEGVDAESAENCYSAELTRGDAWDRLTYSEESEGGRILTDIKVMGDRVILRRSGGISSIMHFEMGYRHSSSYKISPFEFDMEIETEELSVKRDEERILVSAKYLMTVGGARKRCSMTFAVLSAGE